MNAFIKHTFWTDEGVGELSVEEKLALLWLMTNVDRDICGFCKPNKRTFHFQTGMPFEALQRACQALPRTVRILECGTFLICNFVRQQFSKCGVVSTKNNNVISVVRRTLALPEALRRAFYEVNPELVDFSHSLAEKENPSEALQRGYQPLPRGEDKVQEKEEVGIGEERGKQAHQIVEAYPRREDTMQCLSLVKGHLDRGEDFDAMLAGTRAIAAVIAQMPAGAMNKYVCGAVRFFRDKRWTDDPRTWLRAGGSSGSPTPLDLGGRGKTSTVTKIGS